MSFKVNHKAATEKVSCAVISRVWQLHVVRIDPRFKSIWIIRVRVRVYTHSHAHVHSPARPQSHTQPHNQNIKFCVQMLCKLCCALLALVSRSRWVVPHQRKRKINHKRNGGSLPWPAGDNYMQTLADNCCDNRYILVLLSSVMIRTKNCSKTNFPCWGFLFSRILKNCILFMFNYSQM